MEQDKIRLNKYISSSGFCSRRRADEWIEAGKVTVNGIVAENGMKVGTNDEVYVNGKRIEHTDEKKIVAFYKPKGYACTAHRGDESSIYKHFDLDHELKYVGRLDKDSEGLLLLTNDGELCNDVAKARNQHEKEYMVWVNQTITAEFVKGMSEGVVIYDKNKDCDRKTNPCKVKKISDRCFSIVLTQGMNRQIRRMCEAFGYRVRKLQRIRVMNITLEEHNPGDIWEIDAETLQKFREMLK